MTHVLNQVKSLPFNKVYSGFISEYCFKDRIVMKHSEMQLSP